MPASPIQPNTAGDNPSCSSMNSPACRCGTVGPNNMCSAGSYCQESSSYCSALPQCLNTDNKTPNPAPCSCGRVGCLHSGAFCDLAEEKCTSPRCAVTNASAPNVDPCYCALLPTIYTSNIQARFKLCPKNMIHRNIPRKMTVARTTAGFFGRTIGRMMATTRPIIIATIAVNRLM